jgi:O-6-methylguanine DNA methyltransferase
VWVSATGVRRIEFGRLPKEDHTDTPEEWPDNLREAVRQLTEYFDRKREVFDLPLDFDGMTTPFQDEVYERLIGIEYGQVVSYGQVARDIEKPDMARAVGQAVGANPIPIIVPCHRVVASDGRLTGFAGGLKAKVGLLRLEGIGVDGSSLQPFCSSLPLAVAPTPTPRVQPWSKLPTRSSSHSNVKRSPRRR